MAGLVPNNALDSFTALASAAGKGIDLSFLSSARQSLSLCPQIVLSHLSVHAWRLACFIGPCYTPWTLTGVKESKVA